MAAISNGSFAPLNPDFVKYRNEAAAQTRGATDDSARFRGGLVPGPIDYSYLQGSKLDRTHLDPASRSAGEGLPAAYDLEAEGRLTPVLSQGGWGTCWAFASIESMESSLIGSTKKTYDLSELQLAWFMYADESAEKPAFTSRVPESSTTSNPIFDNGGRHMLEQVAALLSRGTGPVYDEDAPYPFDLDTKDRDAWVKYVPNPLPYGAPRFRLQAALRFIDADDAKRAIMQHGGLTVAFVPSARNTTDGSYVDYTNDATGVFYNPPQSFPSGYSLDGHAVMLVGWDDNYPKENFYSSADLIVPPARDGAWKIQNSWGTDNGDRGYYWISYENPSFSVGDPMYFQDGGIAFLLEPVETYDGIYFHDPLGVCRLIDMPMPQVEMANVFTAERDEKIVSVGFHTANTNMAYEIQIYRDMTGDAPDSGRAALSQPQTGYADATGYRAVPLSEPVQIRQGERFAVAVSLILTDSSTPRDTLKIPVEAVVETHSDKVKVSPKESYARAGAEWEGTINEDDPGEAFNMCVKAFTVAHEAPSSGGSSGCSAGAFGAFFVIALPAARLWRTRHAKRA